MAQVTQLSSRGTDPPPSGRRLKGRKRKIDAGQVFHALGDPTRRAIVERLSERPWSVSGLAMPLNISLTAVAQHLQVLEAGGLAHTKKSGRVRTCHLDPAGLSVLEQ